MSLGDSWSVAGLRGVQEMRSGGRTLVFGGIMPFGVFLSSVDKNMKYIPTEDVSGKTK